MKRSLVSVAVLLLICCRLGAEEVSKPALQASAAVGVSSGVKTVELSTITVVVAEFPAREAVEVDSAMLTDILRGELSKLEGFHVVEKDKMEAVCKKKMSLKCHKMKHGLKLAKKFRAQKVVMGYVSETDNAYVIFAEVINVIRKEPEFSMKVKVWSSDMFENSCKNLATAIRRHLRKERIEEEKAAEIETEAE